MKGFKNLWSSQINYHYAQKTIIMHKKPPFSLVILKNRNHYDVVVMITTSRNHYDLCRNDYELYNIEKKPLKKNITICRNHYDQSVVIITTGRVLISTGFREPVSHVPVQEGGGAQW